jgi:hypothetical protein
MLNLLFKQKEVKKVKKVKKAKKISSMGSESQRMEMNQG